MFSVCNPLFIVIEFFYHYAPPIVPVHLLNYAFKDQKVSEAKGNLTDAVSVL